MPILRIFALQSIPQTSIESFVSPVLNPRSYSGNKFDRDMLREISHNRILELQKISAVARNIR